MGATSQEWSRLKVAGLVVAVLGLLVLAIIVFALLLTPFVLIPAGVLAGGWLLRKGLRAHRDSVAAARMAATSIGLAKPGLVHLEAHAATPTPTRAAVTGRPCVWWDVAVWLWYESRGDDTDGGWHQMASRYGGKIDAVEIGDDSDSVTVWLHRAELLLEKRTWESGRDTLPERGIALLDALKFPWQGGQKIRVTEECVEAGALLYVLGTLDERRNVPESMAPGRLERIADAIRTGAWRRHVVGAMPRAFRPVLAVFIGFLDMFTRIGTARARPAASRATAPPALAPEARMVWKGRGDRPFLVSDRPAQGALASLRQRAWVTGGIGAAILCFVLYQVFELL